MNRDEHSCSRSFHGTYDGTALVWQQYRPSLTCLCRLLALLIFFPLPLQVLTREVSRFAEHLEVDQDAKWPLLMTARLKEAQVSSSGSSILRGR